MGPPPAATATGGAAPAAPIACMERCSRSSSSSRLWLCRLDGPAWLTAPCSAPSTRSPPSDVLSGESRLHSCSFISCTCCARAAVSGFTAGRGMGRRAVRGRLLPSGQHRSTPPLPQPTSGALLPGLQQGLHPLHLLRARRHRGHDGHGLRRLLAGCVARRARPRTGPRPPARFASPVSNRKNIKTYTHAPPHAIACLRLKNFAAP